MDARQAREALGAAQAARDAARTAGATRPRGYAIAQGVACALGFTALGLADGRGQWSPWLLTAGCLSLAAFLVLLWQAVHHGGTAPGLDRHRHRGTPAWRVWLLPCAPVALGFLAWFPYGSAGAFVVFGLASGVEQFLRARSATA